MIHLDSNDSVNPDHFSIQSKSQAKILADSNDENQDGGPDKQTVSAINISTLFRRFRRAKFTPFS